MLGGFQLTDPGGVVILTISEQRLVAFLALRDRPVRRLWVAGSLWPESSEHHASANLRSILWRLGRRGSRVVEATRSHLWIAPEVRSDVLEMEALAGRLLGGSKKPHALDLESLYGWGELLPDWYEDWIDIDRERLRQLRLRTLEVVCERLIHMGRFHQAVQTSLAAVEAEPLRESAQRMLISACLAEGSRWTATRHYDVYRDLLSRELGIEPPADIQAMLST